MFDVAAIKLIAALAGALLASRTVPRSLALAPRRIAAWLIGLVGLSGPLFAEAPGAGGAIWPLRWDAPAACPAASVFRYELDSALQQRGVQLRPGDLAVELRIQPNDAGDDWSGFVSITTRHGRGVRTATASSCDELVRGTARLVALSVSRQVESGAEPSDAAGPSAFTPNQPNDSAPTASSVDEPASPPTAEFPALPPVVTSAPPLAPAPSVLVPDIADPLPPRETSVVVPTRALAAEVTDGHWRAYLGPGWNVALLPEQEPDLRLMALYATALTELSVALDVSRATSQSQPSLTRWGVQALLGLHTPLTPTLDAHFAGGMTAAALTATGTQDVATWGLALGSGLDWQFASRWHTRLDGQASLALLRPSFAARERELVDQLWQVPRFGARVGLLVGYAF